MDERRLNGYLSSLYPDLAADLAAVEKRALADHVPVIRRDTQQYLRALLALRRPDEILEVGTAVGFSASFMATYNPVSCRITTIENYQPRISAARENFRRMGLEEEITLLEGDARDVLPELKGPYDLIFMDAAKGQYINYWPQLIRLSGPGSVIVTDNVLQEGDIIESHFAVTRRNRTIHKRMREYLWELTHDGRFVTDILNVGDGLSVSVRVKQ
ncbi:O-methyltransferase [Shuttleworthella satelles]|uniref:O-methyltransferase n=1 Tax=Shuttleworthella satelles TaxID=177972 RepID=UPI0028D60C50|nr:O-methyltransferase [Shuttleworthia satelles]